MVLLQWKLQTRSKTIRKLLRNLIVVLKEPFWLSLCSRSSDKERSVWIILKKELRLISYLFKQLRTSASFTSIKPDSLNSVPINCASLTFYLLNFAVWFSTRYKRSSSSPGYPPAREQSYLHVRYCQEFNVSCLVSKDPKFGDGATQYIFIFSVENNG